MTDLEKYKALLAEKRKGYLRHFLGSAAACAFVTFALNQQHNLLFIAYAVLLAIGLTIFLGLIQTWFLVRKYFDSFEEFSDASIDYDLELEKELNGGRPKAPAVSRANQVPRRPPSPQLSKLKDSLKRKMIPIADATRFPIMQTSARIGTFKEADIFEWVEVKHPTGQKRFNYHSVVNLELDKNFELPADYLMVPPGILYEPAA